MTDQTGSNPWDAAERPDVPIVKGILARQFPVWADADVAYFSEGWDFTVFQVGDEYLLRFPKRETTLPWMAREIVVLDAIEGRVPAPIPSGRVRGEPSAEFPFPFVGYRRLPGVSIDSVPLDAIAPDVARETGRVVGATLAVVHAIPLDVFPPAPSPRDPVESRVATGLSVLAELVSCLPAEVVSRCRGLLESPPPAAPVSVVTHGDLGPEHILVDAASGALTGIIDWTDTGPWDPAGDFVGLWVELGENGLEAALAEYGALDDPTLADRVRFHATGWLLGEARSSANGWRPHMRDHWVARLAERWG